MASPNVQMAPMRVKVAGVAAVTFLLGAVIVSLLPGATRHGSWGCSTDRLGLDTFTLDASGGYESPDAAVRAEANLLASDNVAPAGELRAAASSTTGEFRFDAVTGDLYLRGERLARISVTQLNDGSWTIAQAMYCSPLPS